MTSGQYLVANREIILREEFDDWAILFNPDNGQGFGINPVGVFIWKLLNGQHTVSDIVRELTMNCDEVPKDVEVHVREFLSALFENGLAGQRV